MKVIETALKNLSYAAIKPTYWAGIQDTFLGLMHFHVQAIFHLLFQTYGRIYPQEIANNELKKIHPWDPNMPFTMLVKWFCKCQQFITNSNNPFTKAQLINKILHLIIQMGTFPYDFCEWNNLDHTKKPFPNIITHFTDMEISRCQLLGMQGLHLQNIHQQADKLLNQAESIATTAEATYAENTTIWEENTNLQMKLCCTATSAAAANCSPSFRHEHTNHGTLGTQQYMAQ